MRARRPPTYDEMGVPPPHPLLDLPVDCMPQEQMEPDRLALSAIQHRVGARVRWSGLCVARRDGVRTYVTGNRVERERALQIVRAVRKVRGVDPGVRVVDKQTMAGIVAGEER